METRGRRISFGAVSSLLLFIGVLSFRFLALSTERAMLFSLRLPNIFINLSGALNFQDVVQSIFLSFAKFLLPFIPITLGFAVLALYGAMDGEDKRLALICAVPASIAGVIISDLTFPSIFFYGGVVGGSFLITGLGETYSKELEKWGNFRVGTSSLGKVFLILSVLLMLGILLHTTSRIRYYRQEFRNTTQEFIMQMASPESLNVSTLSDQEIMEQLPEDYREYLNSLPEEERKKVMSKLRSKTASQVQELTLNAQKLIRDRFLRSEKFSSLIDFVLFLTVLAIGGILLFLSKILYGPLAGLVTLSNRFT